MQKRTLIAAVAALLSLPLAVYAADSKKKGGFANADTNGDGKVSQAEYVASVKGKQDDKAAKARFAELDTDKDGFLSQQEYSAGQKSKKKKDS